MGRRKLSAGGGGGICALKVAGTRCGQVVCGRKASWLEAAQQAENVGRTSDLEGGREEYFVQGLDLCQAWHARQRVCKVSEGNRETLKIPAHTRRRDSMAGEEAEEGHFIFSPFPQWLGIQGCDLDQSPSFKRQQGRGEKACRGFHSVPLPPKQNCRRREKKISGKF